MTRHAPQRIRHVFARLVAACLLVLAAAGPTAPAALAADPPTMTARVLLQGHARVGSWIAIEVHLVNSGPSISGEIRLQGGSQGGTRYATAVQLDSPSDKTWILHAQPPSFGQQLEVVLASSGQILLRQKVAVTIHDPGQLTVGVIAENGPKVVGTLSLPAVQNQQPAVDHPAHGRRPADPDRGVVRARPPRLAGRRRLDPQHGAADRDARLAGARRAPRDRRRDGRDRRARRVSRRHPALSPELDGRRRGGAR